MKTIFKYKKINKRHHSVQTRSGLEIGEFIEDVDGWFYFFLTNYNGGAFSAEILNELSNKLDKLNSNYNTKLNDYFKQSKQ